MPHQGCPFQCVFCDQKKISGSSGTEDVTKIIEQYLSTIKDATNSKIEVAFYGGSFTAINRDRQISYLSKAKNYIKSGLVDHIRISTRPDFIDDQILNYLKKYGVAIIELGVQSLDNEVLEKAGRGHTANSVYKAAEMIKSAGFKLGIQVMPGLPGDTTKTMQETTQKVIQIKPNFVRIYPTVVIKDTKLHRMMLCGEYTPLTLWEAVDICSYMYMKFKDSNIQVIRTGLQASEILEKNYVIAGPYHPSFGELVINRIAYDLLKKQLNLFKNETDIKIIVPKQKLSKYLGQKRKNIIDLQEEFCSKIKIMGHEDLCLNKFKIVSSKYDLISTQNYI